MTLYSIDPTGFNPPPPGSNVLHGYKVLGETEVTVREVQKNLAQTLEQAVRASDGGMGMCFNPRHALHIISGSSSYDLVICFECGWVYVYSGSKLVAQITSRGSSEAFNQALKAARIPLADF